MSSLSNLVLGMSLISLSSYSFIKEGLITIYWFKCALIEIISYLL